MIRASFAVVAILALCPGTSRAQLTVERQVRFVVPEAEALAEEIALHEDTALFGTVEPAAYLFQLDQGQWWMDRLPTPDGGSFSTGVSLSDGVALVAGKPHAYVYRFDGAGWSLEATLSDERGDPGFGHVVGIDGDVAVVGTRSENVQVFRYDGGRWNLEAKIAPRPPNGKRPYGYADHVAIDGEHLLVSKSATMGNEFEGVYAYRYNGDVWAHIDTIILGEPGGKTVFQGRIALDGDVALIDADYDDEVHVFRYAELDWKREAILTPPEGIERSCSCLPIPSADNVQCDGDSTPNFGVGVAVDGDSALVGANLEDIGGTDSGAAYLYRYDGNTWSYQLMLQGEPGQSCGAGFGRLVDIDGDGALVRQGHSAYFFRILGR